MGVQQSMAEQRVRKCRVHLTVEVDVEISGETVDTFEPEDLDIDGISNNRNYDIEIHEAYVVGGDITYDDESVRITCDGLTYECGSVLLDKYMEVEGKALCTSCYGKYALQVGTTLGVVKGK